ncbi:hypothetical protein GCM10011366_13150 [Ornithinimicrobium tianjinense]|uniref:Uncharacterized protein n=1 Tax=Ornithinimicrobium tianjinense TaxID=1195761 RepID=A0A917BK47_9MICO|nr:hypothetical protein GCM10011366_13150 [Ornithinimicrobium tianjinense]
MFAPPNLRRGASEGVRDTPALPPEPCRPNPAARSPQPPRRGGQSASSSASTSSEMSALE